MKIKEIRIQGFRGFNSARSFDVHSQLTLFAAPNSHGKTSISEACEWLLYGQTSKVALAESKEEYKDSYRNIHFPQPESANVSMVLETASGPVTLLGLLSGKDLVRKVDGNVVREWTFARELIGSPKPFILQHALTDLLLAKPVDRFNRFSELLGFDDVAVAHKDLVALCTKPPLGPEADRLIAESKALITRAQADVRLEKVAKLLSRGIAHFQSARQELLSVARSSATQRISDDRLLENLQKRRDEALAKIFNGRIAVRRLSVDEKEKRAAAEARILNLVTVSVTTRVVHLNGLRTHSAVMRKLELFEIGLGILQHEETVCPLCERPLTDTVLSHIKQKHVELQTVGPTASVQELRKDLRAMLEELDGSISDYYRLCVGGTKELVSAQASLPQLLAIFSGDGNAAKKHEIESLFQGVDSIIKSVTDAGAGVRAAIRGLKGAVDLETIPEEYLSTLAERLAEYRTACHSCDSFAVANSGALGMLQVALDAEMNKQAGTTSLNLIIELLHNLANIEKSLRVQAIAEGLKGLKVTADELVTSMMLDAISGDLAKDVSNWYNRIRTTGDPDVHFAGFDMKRTQHGGRVQIKATSYGRDLVSAVSSLSESKLNALGLAISIAMNVSPQSSFDFLIIDDPIQSWDKDHEMQFIEVIRDLIERGKQVVLLSHNVEWIRQVRSACSDLDGLYYEITGYTEDGPLIKALPWVEPKQRLQSIAAILEDQSADSIRLQQAEQELRQVFSSLTSMLYEGQTGTYKDPSNLNAEKIRKCLTECNVDGKYIAGIMAIFLTVDDAHHSSESYAPNRQKIKQYHGVAQSVLQTVESRLKAFKTPVIPIRAQGA